MSEKIEITVMKGKGALGNSLYVNDYRVYGNKPYGGGSVVYRFEVDKKLLEKALEEIEFGEPND